MVRKWVRERQTENMIERYTGKITERQTEYDRQTENMIDRQRK